MQMYFEITDAESVAKIDAAMKPIHDFDEKLHALQKKYVADKPEAYPLHLNTEREFKVSIEKYKTGYELRPRKSNKKFYSEFMSGLTGVSYNNLKAVLFGDEKCRPSLSYTKKGSVYYIDSTMDIALAYRELTASEYKDLTEAQEQSHD